MSQDRVQQLLKDGIAAARNGNKAMTRHLLQEATALEPNNETAWMWLAGVAENAREALTCLKRILVINPNNERARTALAATRLQAGYGALKAQDKASAWQILREVVDEDPTHEAAWLALSAAAPTPKEALECLHRVLEINPNNDRARAGLAWYGPQTVAPVKKAVWSCPLCSEEGDESHEVCPSCGAFLTLRDPAIFARHTVHDPESISAVIDRLASIPSEEADFDSYQHLSLALLNQQRFSDALVELQSALRLQPRHRELRRFVEALKQYLAAEEAAARAEEERVRSSRKTVVIVDDSPTVRKLVSLTLERRGFRVVEAKDGYEAVDLVRQQGVPHLMLLDITMPGMDGYQLCRLLRQTRETARLPIVMLSGKDGFFNKVRGRMAGATEYLTKPFEPEGLARTVEKYLGAAQAVPSSSTR